MFLFRGTRLRRIYPFSQNITPRSCRYICLSLCLSFSLSVLPEAIAILFPLYWERSLVLGVLSNVWVTQPDATLWHGWTTSSGQPSYRHLMSQSRCAISVHRPYPHSWSVVTTDSKGTWLQLLHPKRARTHTCGERLQTDVEAGYHISHLIHQEKWTLPCRCRCARSLGVKQTYCRGNL